MNEIAISPCGPIRATIRPPGSKSLTNRALLCAAVATGDSLLRGALDSEDTRVMLGVLREIGIVIESSDEGRTLKVFGCGGNVPQRTAELFVANSGTTMRFVAAMLAVIGGDYRLDGVPRMRARPIRDLLTALVQLGADAGGEVEPDFPPVRLRSAGLGGGLVPIRGDTSSQFLSGLLMAAPYARSDVTIVVEGPLVSQPYVTMTLQVMEAFGVRVECPDKTALARFQVSAPQHYIGREYDIEPDASAASYFWAAAAITGGRVEVEGLSFSALQGDVAFCRCLERMGCDVQQTENGIAVEGKALHGIDVDMNAISDTVQTLAAVALFAKGSTRIRGVAHIRHKETDRIGDLARELRRLGAHVEELADGLRIEPGPLHGAALETYNDHRMAMSLALVGLRQAGVLIRNPACVEKTYPRFFDDLQRACAPSA